MNESVDEILREHVERRPDISHYEFCVYNVYFDSNQGELLPRANFWVSRGQLIREGVGPLAAMWLKEPEIVGSYLGESFYVDEEAIGLTSRVRNKWGEITHLQLIDFDCNKSDEDLENVKGTLGILSVAPGFIMDSGNSYHFLGLRSESYGHFVRLMEQMQLHDTICYDPLSITNWPALQIKKGYAVLRQTRCHERGKDEPRLVERFGDFFVPLAHLDY